MKTLGIVGGIGPESTVDNDRSFIQMWREWTAGRISAPALRQTRSLMSLWSA